MIREFFSHLLWEIRALHFDSASGERVNDELDETLLRYVEKWNARQLVPDHAFDRELTAAENDKYLRVLQCKIDAVQMVVDGLVADAIECLEQPLDSEGCPTPLVRHVNADAFIEGLE
jgi:hypothetical protein